LQALQNKEFTGAALIYQNFFGTGALQSYLLAKQEGGTAAFCLESFMYN